MVQNEWILLNTFQKLVFDTKSRKGKLWALQWASLIHSKVSKFCLHANASGSKIRNFNKFHTLLTI